MAKSKLLIALSLAALAVWFMPPLQVHAQNCGCSSSLCCSQYGYCGSGDAYCGTGCRSGPCYSTTTTTTTGTSVSAMFTERFFSNIIGKAASNCAGKSFYTRQAFLNAASRYSNFANVGSDAANRREVAAFFAHVTHETGHFCYIEEINKATYCDTNYPQYPCNPSKKYYGRGPLQLTWNYNYGAAGAALGFDGLNSPETVATSVSTSFKAALWFWMQNVHPVLGQGFGATIRAINGALECNGGPGASAVQSRVSYYQTYCRWLGVSPGDNLTC